MKGSRSQSCTFQSGCTLESPGELLNHTNISSPLHPPPTQDSDLTSLGWAWASFFFLEVSILGDSNMQPLRGITTREYRMEGERDMEKNKENIRQSMHLKNHTDSLFSNSLMPRKGVFFPRCESWHCQPRKLLSTYSCFRNTTEVHDHRPVTLWLRWTAITVGLGLSQFLHWWVQCPRKLSVPGRLITLSLALAADQYSNQHFLDPYCQIW